MSTRRCLGCMRPIGEEDPCPHCGFSPNTPAPDGVLPLKTVLNNTYVIGKALRIDEDGVHYIGFDGYSQSPVLILEFMPSALAQRRGLNVFPLAGKEAMYKALLSDFEELYTSLSKLGDLASLCRVERLLHANNTCYAVCEYFDAITLNQYAAENAGELPWELAGPMFRQLMEDLCVMHAGGVIHRGISPETLILTANGQMKLTDFSVNAYSRVPAGSEGYAAPEQYTKTVPHGDWTDVYGLCATLYKVLSGTMPPAANTRAVNDNLIPLDQLVESIPSSVSLGVMAGLAVDPRRRVQDMRSLIQTIYFASPTGGAAQTASAEPTRESEAVPLREPEDGTPKGGKKKNWFLRMPVWAKVLLICLPFIILVAILLYVLMMPDYSDEQDVYSYQTSSVVSEAEPQQGESSTASQTSSAAEPGVMMITMLDLVNKQLDSVQSSSVAQQFEITVTEQYSNTYEKGFIIDQSIPEGTVVAQGSELQLTVSKGKQNVIIPSYSGYSVNSYRNLLEGLGFTVSVEQQYSDTVTSGSIIGTDPEVGTSLDREVLSAVTIYQSKGPDPAQAVSSTVSIPVISDTDPEEGAAD